MRHKINEWILYHAGQIIACAYGVLVLCGCIFLAYLLSGCGPNTQLAKLDSIESRIGENAGYLDYAIVHNDTAYIGYLFKIKARLDSEFNVEFDKQFR
jgi:hypothetical protein